MSGASGASMDELSSAGSTQVLVALGSPAHFERLIRFAARLVGREAGSWVAVTVETRPSDAARQAALGRAFELARQLGGEAAVLYGTNVVDALLDHARRVGASILVVGAGRRSPLAGLLNQTLCRQLTARAPHLTIATVGSGSAGQSPGSLLPEPSGFSARDAGIALVSAAAATAIGWFSERWIGLNDLSLVFIVAVVVVAARTRMAAAVLTAALCFFAYNFVFMEPRLTLSIAAPEGVVSVVLFMIAALVAGRLASRLRVELLALKAANAHTIARQALSRELTGATDENEVIEAGVRAFWRSIGAHATIGQDCRVVAGIPAEELGPDDAKAAAWTMEHAESTGRFADRFRDATGWYLPLRCGEERVWILRLWFPMSTGWLHLEKRRLAEAMAGDLAQALLRIRLVSELQDARVSHQTERLRTALLSSVSHDLRSPLATIIGAATSLDSLADQLGPEDRHNLLDAIRVEGERLNRYVGNLLDMTRLGHGGLQVQRDWIGIGELIGAAVGRVKRNYPHARFDLRIPTETAPIWVHPALIEQALHNVLENAAEFSPPGAAVVVAVRLDEGRLQVDIRDHGPGIPASERSRIFDMFYRIERGDRVCKGSGLGLAICQGMVAAHGGSVEVRSPAEGGGTIISLVLPEAHPEPVGEGRDGSIPSDRVTAP